jgi:hypothetical protein
VRGKQPSFTIHRNYKDAVARCEQIASAYLRSESGKEIAVMDEATRKDLEQSTRQFENPRGVIETMKSRLNDAWEGIKHYATHPQDLIFNDYTAGAVADVRRRVVEESWYGKTLDDTVTREGIKSLGIGPSRWVD